MPVDKYGNRADVVSDPTSIPSRMNISVHYEQYFNASSKRVKHLVTEKLYGIDNSMDAGAIVEILTPEETLDVFSIPLGMTGIINNQQHAAYSDLVKSNNIYAIKEILTEIVNKEFYIYYTVNDDRKPYQIVEDLKLSPYGADIDHIMIPKNGGMVPSKDKMMIAPLYMIMLFKTGDEFLSVSSAKTNHYNFPISVSKANRHRQPWRNSPTKVVSETENRLFAGYTKTRAGMAEVKDRANSISTHKLVYENILNADKPTNIDKIVDRAKTPYGTDQAIELVNSILNCSGIEVVYR